MRRVLVSLVLLLALSIPAAASAQEDGPLVVRVGGYINDVQQLDLQSHSYAVDVYLWFRWCEEGSIRRGRSSS